MVGCAVASCNNWFKAGSTITYHTFPKDGSTKRAWKMFCKRGDELVWKNARICSQHFKEDDYESNKINDILGILYKKKLRRTAVPTVYFVEGCRPSQMEVMPVSEDKSSECADINLENQPNKTLNATTRTQRYQLRGACKTKNAVQQLRKLSPIKRSCDKETNTEDGELENLQKLLVRKNEMIKALQQKLNKVNKELMLSKKKHLREKCKCLKPVIKIERIK